MIIAIDGPGGSGKTTVARTVAERLGLAHLDTGAFYRTATLAVLRSDGDLSDEEIVAVMGAADMEYRHGAMLLNDDDVSDEIRSEEVTAEVSRVSAIPDVRTLMVEHQRAWVAANGGSAVVEGRDIGTVVFPDADVKVFLTARPEVRAARRAGETDATVGDVREDLARRDRYDSQRPVSPLTAATDAVEIDTSDLAIETVVDLVVALSRRSQGSPTPPSQ